MNRTELKPSQCPFCDFGSGYRGMDSCGKCAGTGSGFWIKVKGEPQFYPNTKDGHEEAMAARDGA